MKGASGSKYYEKGKKYHLRLINFGINNNFHNNYLLTIITSDFVPIKPYTTSSVSISIS